MQRLKAKPNQKYGKYTAVKTETGCHDCVVEHDPALCNEMPICSSDSDNSVIFKIGDENEMKLLESAPLLSLPSIRVVQEYNAGCTTTIFTPNQQLSYTQTGSSVKVAVEISNIELIRLLKGLENIDNIIAEGLQLVYRVESEKGVTFREVE